METRIVQAKTTRAIAKAAGEGASALKDGLVVGFPTETVYGVGVIATDPQALARLRQLKCRPKDPFSVHLGRPEDAHRYVRDVPSAARRLIDRAWPGPVTMLLEVGGQLADPKLRKAGLYRILCADDVIALRAPEGPAAQAMLSAVDVPVLATSANLTGSASPRTAEDAMDALGDGIDLMIDTGPTRYGTDSTIVRFGPDGWKIVRPGVYDARRIQELLMRRILFVCTGNTCRSPMAVGLAQKVLAEQMGCDICQLAQKGVQVLSAGVFAAGGMKPTPEALDAAKALGVDISGHRSQKLTVELINGADMVFCMTNLQLVEIRQVAAGDAGKVRRLDPAGDISDPVGSGVSVYRQTAERIEKILKNTFEKGLP